MGIPLEYVPPSSRREQKPKPDAVAASARSSIRRQNAVRRTRRHGSSNSRSPRPTISQNTVETEPSVGDREVPDPNLTLPMIQPFPDPSHSIGRRESGQHVLRESLRNSSQPRRMRIPRESSLRFEMGRPYWYGDFPQPIVPPAPRPRHAPAPEHLTLSPRFAPAHQMDGDLFSRSNTGSPTVNAQTSLLRSMGHRSVTDATERRRAEVDGLGDRDRSPTGSGFDDDELHDSWETLLTTITPDDHLPSFDSSFTSATASASSALSRGSANTLTPASSYGAASPRLRLMFDEAFPDGPANCEPTDSDTEPDSDIDTAALRVPRAMLSLTLAHSLSRRRSEDLRRRNARNSDENNHESSNDNDNNETAASSSNNHHLPSMPSDLQEIHGILDHLARRDDIPDEWWATAGLSRTIRQELDINSSTRGD
ncbi:hypothetical protein LOZ65_002950 [Ophidiomyces ophidiicola]|nr:hypothetical protein LOZ65_002950 [Ophidiomyces ophidiicola]